jgi:glycosyltransferase involved in cell wall biosynthesis
MKINLKAPIARTGYGVVGKKIAEHMFADPDIDLVLIPVSSQNLHVEQDEVALYKQILSKRETPHIDGHSLKIWHQNDLMDHIGSGKKIGWPIFEMDRLTDVEAHHIGACDKVIVCSEWARDIVIKGLYNRYKWPSLESFVKVVPLGVDRSIFFNAPTQHEATRFFNCGKWEIRKGHDIIIKAFNQAFTPEDNVELHMMCQNPFTQIVDNNAWNRYYKSGPLSDKVSLINPVHTHREVAHIMQQMDCGVFPARAEGFNLELLEAMSCGLKIITTNYSAHTEFCNDCNSYLIDIDETEPAHDGVWFKGQGNWAKMGENQIDQLIQHMRAVHHGKQLGESGWINTEGIKTAEKFSWQNSVKLLKSAI